MDQQNELLFNQMNWKKRTFMLYINNLFNHAFNLLFEVHKSHNDGMHRYLDTSLDILAVYSLLVLMLIEMDFYKM